MERDKYLREIEKILDNLIEEKALLSEHIRMHESKLVNDSWRYKTEKGYKRLLKWRKIKNSIDYLLLLRENKDN
ncbi:MAG: hypothetical protein CMI54_06050 [Parcubacteria group bacterium]|nr:hypothetical protein [Parcubacteria group bacterium]|tara:strand:- start:3349 stop:3570 length:222 start_codon:yes stop_codon:yes gene_type:complete